jgi:iron complex outermembrane recepter protein
MGPRSSAGGSNAKGFLVRLPYVLFLCVACGGASDLLVPVRGAEKSNPAAPPAAHAARELDFNLPAQPAASALLAFSKQTKIEVLFSFNALRGAVSKEVNGRFAPEAALKKLLEGTGFTAQPHGDDKFVVARDTRKTGGLKGRLLDPQGLPVRGARVNLPATQQSTTTSAAGEFAFSAVEAGTHALIVNAEGFDSLHLTGLEVEPDRVLALAPRTLQLFGDPARLAPFVVKDRTTRRDPFDRSEAQFAPRTAGSNLDLARTENDALPFNVYNRDQIARSGVVNLNEFLQRELLDTDGASHPPEQDGTQPTFLAGSTNLNLRGFGSDQTIILVNGRRLPETLINGSQSQTPDVNFIPLSLVQQVEVLPVSAASLYSGNAVGGIINIVLRPGVDAEATEVALTYTNALGGYDAPQASASFLHSRSLLGGALRVRFNASITRTEPPTEMELGYRRRHDSTNLPLSTSIYRATPNIRSLAIVSDAATVDPPTTVPPAPPLFGSGTATVTSVAPGADGSGGLAAFRGREGVRNFGFFDSPGGLASSLDSIDYPYGREQRRTAYFASVVYDVTPWLQLGFDGTYTHSVLHRGYDVIAGDLRLRSESPFNPYGVEATVSLNEMAPRLGENYSEARLEFGSGVLSALFKLPRDWRLLLDTQYGRNVAKYRGIAGADYARWQGMVDAGTYNPLRDTQVFAPPAEFYDRVLVYRGGPGRFVTLGDYSTLDSALRLTNHAFPLPTGVGAINVGADYRQNKLAQHTDERRFADGTLAIDPVRYTGRVLGRYSIFGEMQAPLLPRAWLPRSIKSIDTDMAVRYIASSQAKESNVAPTFALKAQLPAGFSFRGSVSTSSRYPTPQMSRLSNSNSAPGRIVGVDLKKAYDPQQKETYTVQQDDLIDPDLRPEDALTQTAGLLYHRGRIHRIRAALDFVDTYKVNELIALDVQTILNLEHLFPDRVVRKTVAGADGKVGTVATVVTGTINSSWRRSDNWNASLDYAWTECFGGTFEAYGRLLYFTRYDHLLLPGAHVVNELSHPEGGSSNLLRYRAKFGATWSNRQMGLGMDGHYYHSRVLPEVEWASQGSDRILPFWQFDAFIQGNIGHWVRWLPRELRAQVRVNNVFSADYPAYPTSGTGAGAQAYGDWRGRVYSLSLTTTF